MDEIYDRIDKHGFYQLPTSFDIKKYDLMRKFVFSFPEKTRNRLAKAINGKGAFRRFRDTIRQMGVDDRWYAYRQATYRKKRSNGVRKTGWSTKNKIPIGVR